MKKLTGNRAVQQPGTERVDEEPLPPCMDEERAEQTANAAVAAASHALEEAFLEQENLKKQLHTAQKADVAALESQLVALEPRLQACRGEVVKAQEELKIARASLERQRKRIFVRIQANRNIELARQFADAYARAQEDASDQLTQRQIERISKSRTWEAAQGLQSHSVSSLRSIGSRATKSFSGRFHSTVSAMSTSRLLPLRDSSWQIPAQEMGPDPLELIKQRLGLNFGRVVDLFRKWDVNCDGEISIEELRMALCALEISCDEWELKALFEQLDTDKSQSIDFHELSEALRKHVPKPLPVNKITLQPPVRREHHVDVTAAERRAEKALRLALQSKLQKVTELFASWDANGDGMISKKEMKRALAAQCIQCDAFALDALFRKLDRDDSGGIEFRELNRLLRREFSILEPLIEAQVVPQSKRMPSRAPDPMSAWTEQQPDPMMTEQGHAPAIRKRRMKKTESSRSMFERRMQQYNETNLRELMKEKDMLAASKAETLRRSRTEPQLMPLGPTKGKV